jgi:hypothetical protein
MTGKDDNIEKIRLFVSLDSFAIRQQLGRRFQVEDQTWARASRRHHRNEKAILLHSSLEVLLVQLNLSRKSFGRLLPLRSLSLLAL